MMYEGEDDPIIEKVDSDRDDIEEYADDILPPSDEVDAQATMLARKEASYLAELARQYANRMQFAATTAVGLARDVEAACTTVRKVAERSAYLAGTAVWKERKHEERKNARKAALMNVVDKKMKTEKVQREEDDIEGYAHVIIVSSEEPHADKAAVAWKEAAKLAEIAKEYVNMMMFTAEQAVGLAEDLQKKCTETNSVTQRSAYTAKMGLRKKRKQVKQEKDRKKRRSPLQEETRERNNNRTRKRRQDATAGSSNSSTGRSEQQQRQHRLRSHPPDDLPPLSLTTSPLKRSLVGGKRKK